MQTWVNDNKKRNHFFVMNPLSFHGKKKKKDSFNLE